MWIHPGTPSEYILHISLTIALENSSRVATSISSEDFSRNLIERFLREFNLRVLPRMPSVDCSDFLDFSNFCMNPFWAFSKTCSRSYFLFCRITHDLMGFSMNFGRTKRRNSWKIPRRTLGKYLVGTQVKFV